MNHRHNIDQKQNGAYTKKMAVKNWLPWKVKFGDNVIKVSKYFQKIHR